MNQLIVGVDDSPGSRRALLWAADEAVRRDAGLVAVAVIQPSTWLHARAHQDGHYGAGIDCERRHADALLRELCAPLDSRSLTVEKEVIAGTPPAQVLLDRARGSDGLVVGTRGRGGFAGVLLGSVSQRASVHPSCPITVVPLDAGDPSDRHRVVREPRGKVVVGVDTSMPARAALVRAAAEARLRGAVLEAVTVREPPALPAEWSSPWAADRVVWIGTTPVPTGGLNAEAKRLRQEAIARWQSAADQVLDRQISELTADERPDRIERLVIIARHTAEALLDAASRADLLVVGSRGRRGVTHRLFGSVSQQCVRHASVPVMVVPSDDMAGRQPMRSPAATSAGHARM
jgi:nucleotide-binding universal stress UspA family protein